ncbi:helix-turn-helix domain-containing protein [Mucilaginibacter sp. X4EP1]|uniref:helix-turn-helix domain-containing protein n=1 Tax=Mucilaginibacter sp. X4EP1 TaxID=2723092 RepID=UPI00216923F6|nr:AraC family transcriptional regulator [Mucilaginibacter sp. X4EP1]MCS3814597.1 AraC-like DNA-binding protein [Mucilaginibacter sp. X4EP1]
MKPVIQMFGESFLYSCSFDKTHAYEQFVPENVLVYQISGETQIYHQRGEMVLEEGQILLARRNQFAKSIKVPAKDKVYQCISVLLTNDRLQQFALDNDILCEDKYHGIKNILLEPNTTLKDYFLSVLPYIQSGKNVSKKLTSIKVNEAIQLLLEMRTDLESFLFDFSDPHKQNLEEFMLKNFHHNAPIKHFARLSGRSLTSFKRDFSETFKTSPATWLKDKRLSEAYYLIKKKSQNPRDIYLDLGFENLSHFYTAFKQKYGHTPAKIKLQN